MTGTDTLRPRHVGKARTSRRERDALPLGGGYRTPSQERLITYKQDAPSKTARRDDTE